MFIAQRVSLGDSLVYSVSFRLTEARGRDALPVAHLISLPFSQLNIICYWLCPGPLTNLLNLRFWKLVSWSLKNIDRSSGVIPRTTLTLSLPSKTHDSGGWFSRLPQSWVFLSVWLCPWMSSRTADSPDSCFKPLILSPASICRVISCQCLCVIALLWSCSGFNNSPTSADFSDWKSPTRRYVIIAKNDIPSFLPRLLLQHAILHK